MGRRFVFELQAVLDQRLRAEREAQFVLAQVQQERLGIEAELSDLRDRVASDRAAARAMMVGRVSSTALREHVAGELGADRRARALALKLAGVQKRIDSARALLRGASVQREAIERLRERRYEAWREAQAKDEQLELDDLMVMRAGLRSGEHGAEE